MADPALRARVERLLRGDIRADDFTRLLLSLRDRSFGRETVRELGDFVAHADERNKGITTQAARDFFVGLRFKIPNLQKAIDVSNLPLNFAEVLEAGFRGLDAAIIKRDTGLRQKAAYRVLRTVIDTLKPNGLGGLRSGHLDAEAQTVLLSCIGYIKTRSAFDDARLFAEVCGALEHNKLLFSNEHQAFSQIKAPLILFAVSAMHNCRIDLGDGTYAELMAAGDLGDTKIGVFSKAMVLDENGKHFFVSAPIFTTSLDAFSHCEPALLGDYASWPFPIELAASGKLDRLG